jgi:hypothetical protein
MPLSLVGIFRRSQGAGRGIWRRQFFRTAGRHDPTSRRNRRRTAITARQAATIYFHLLIRQYLNPRAMRSLRTSNDVANIIINATITSPSAPPQARGRMAGPARRVTGWSGPQELAGYVRPRRAAGEGGFHCPSRASASLAPREPRSAARRYHATAVPRSFGTPSPSWYKTPMLLIAVTLPRSAAWWYQRIASP